MSPIRRKTLVFGENLTMVVLPVWVAADTAAPMPAPIPQPTRANQHDAEPAPACATLFHGCRCSASKRRPLNVPFPVSAPPRLRSAACTL